MNPFGQIPVLEDEGVTIAESIALLEYLEERYPTPASMPAGVVGSYSLAGTESKS